MGSSQIPIDSSIGHGLKFPILAALTANSSRIPAIVKRFFTSSPRTLAEAIGKTSGMGSALVSSRGDPGET